MKTKTIAGLVGLAAIVTTSLFNKGVSEKAVPNRTVFDTVYNGNPITVTKMESGESTNLKLEGVDANGVKRSIYAFDYNKDGNFDQISPNYLRSTQSSPFNKMSENVMASYLTR